MLKEYVKYYYQALPAHQREAYLALYKGIANHEPRIPVRGLKSGKELRDVITAVYNDTPGFFYLDPKKQMWYTFEDESFVLQPVYLYDREKSLDYERKLADGLKIFYQRYIRPGMSEYEREKVIHDYLVRTITYDMDAAERVKMNADLIDEAFNVLGALLKKSAVCWGIALAFKLLCDYCEVKNFVVIGAGEADWAGDTHAWNIVKLDGHEYHVDVTWDIKEKGDMSFMYDYFNLPDSLIRFDHSWTTDIYPPCTCLDYNYYHKNALYVKRLKDIEPFVRQRIKAGERYIAFKFADELPPNEHIVAALGRALQASRIRGQYMTAVARNTHNIYLQIEEQK